MDISNAYFIGKIFLLAFLHCLLFPCIVAPPYSSGDTGHITWNASNFEGIFRVVNDHDVWPIITAWVNISYFRKEDQKIVTSTEEVGLYGAGPVHRFGGYVIPTVPIDACTDVQNIDHAVSKPWIALVKRGGCTFANKAMYAAKAGANGVIVYNYFGDITTMDIEGTGIDGVMIPRDYAAVIRKALRHRNQVWVDVSMGKDMTPAVDEGVILSQSKTYVLLTFILWLYAYLKKI
ncbi:RING finger protein 148-like [Glandiceps talaboti]